MTNVSAGHTLYLEELNVKPGDSVSYYARVGDNDTVAGSQKALSDMYFVRVRAAAEGLQEGGVAGAAVAAAAAAAGEPGRRAVRAGAADHRRDVQHPARQEEHRTPTEPSESAVVVGLMQKRLREQVNELLTNFAERVGNQAERFKKITDFLKQSVPEMQTAEGKLQAGSPDAALPAEHRALEFLQKAEEEYELQVSANQQQGGGGGGGGQQGWPTSSRTCSSSKSTRWPTSTRRRSARRSSRPTRRSTSSPRS